MTKQQIEIWEGDISRPAKEGDVISVSEIVSGAGISGGHGGEILEVCKTENGDDAYLLRMEDGKVRMASPQGKWGYAYDYFSEYKLK